MSFANFVGDLCAAQAADLRASAARSAAAARRIQEGYVAKIEDGNAGNLAEKVALREALATFAPSHPLLVDKSLQERIQRAGVVAFRATDGSWNAAREAGKTFKP